MLISENIVRRYLKTASLPDLSRLISMLNRIPGVDESAIADQWKEGQDTFWYSIFVNPFIKREMNVETRRHGPHERKVVEFETNLRSLGQKLERAIKDAGGYSVKVVPPKRKKPWVDPRSRSLPGEPKSYYDEATVIVEFYISRSSAEEIS